MGLEPADPKLANRFGLDAEGKAKYARLPRWTRPFGLLLVSNLSGFWMGVVVAMPLMTGKLEMVMSGAWITMMAFGGVLFAVANHIRSSLEDRKPQN